MSGTSDKRDVDSKICGKEIHIGARLDIGKLVNAQIEYVKKQCTNEKNAEFGQSATAGNSGAATSRGNVIVGENGVGTVRGNNIKIRGGLGAILVAAEENTNSYEIDTWAVSIVDGENIKQDTWYKVVDGKFIEV